MTEPGSPVQEIGDYELCGWRVRSALALPELSAWAGDTRAPDVEIAISDFPATLEDLVVHTPILQVDRAGRARITIEGVCDYLVEHGSSIRVMPRLPVDTPDIRLFLLGAGLGILCHQRGVLPIHAAAVEIDGRAVIMTGSSGMGKSTLADAFLRNGYRVLSDDVAPLTLSGGEIRVVPAVQRIRLWEDSAHHARWVTSELEQCRASLAKYNLPLDRGYAPHPLVPAALIHLGRSLLDGKYTCQRLRGAEAMRAMRHQVYRWRALVAMCGAPAAYARVSEAAARIPLHANFDRPFDYASLDDTVAAIAGIVRDGK